MLANNKKVVLILETLEKGIDTLNAPVITLMAKNHHSPYRLLIATLLSLRTKDETTHVAASKLFSRAPDPPSLLLMDHKEIERLIYPVGFYKKKAKLILKITRILIEKYGGQVPNDEKTLLNLPGVGRKTAMLILGKAFGVPSICVDTHVHRISNRLGLVTSKTPEKTEEILKAIAPKEYWITLNDHFVALGQTICRPTSPKCSICLVAHLCPKINVIRSR